MTQGKNHEGTQSQQVGQSGRNHAKEDVHGRRKRWKVKRRKVSNSGVDVEYVETYVEYAVIGQLTTLLVTELVNDRSPPIVY